MFWAYKEIRTAKVSPCKTVLEIKTLYHQLDLLYGTSTAFQQLAYVGFCSIIKTKYTHHPGRGTTMLFLDNLTNTVRDDLRKTIRKGSRVSIAAACFSVYAYQKLKEQLEGVEELRFLFTSPTFLKEKVAKAKREFYIPRLNRERSIYGTEFEVKLRNELTLKAISRECADWVRCKVTFKSNTTQEQMPGFITVDESTYMPINGFTTVDLVCERGNNVYNFVTRTEASQNSMPY